PDGHTARGRRLGSRIAPPRSRGVRAVRHGAATPRLPVRHGGQRAGATLLLTSPRRAPSTRAAQAVPERRRSIMWERSKRPLSAAALVGAFVVLSAAPALAHE